jgi:hypothetical protein
MCSEEYQKQQEEKQSRDPELEASARATSSSSASIVFTWCNILSGQRFFNVIAMQHTHTHNLPADTSGKMSSCVPSFEEYQQQEDKQSRDPEATATSSAFIDFEWCNIRCHTRCACDVRLQYIRMSASGYWRPATVYPDADIRIRRMSASGFYTQLEHPDVKLDSGCEHPDVE